MTTYKSRCIMWVVILKFLIPVSHILGLMHIFSVLSFVAPIVIPILRHSLFCGFHFLTFLSGLYFVDPTSPNLILWLHLHSIFSIFWEFHLYFTRLYLVRTQKLKCCMILSPRIYVITSQSYRKFYSCWMEQLA